MTKDCYHCIYLGGESRGMGMPNSTCRRKSPTVGKHGKAVWPGLDETQRRLGCGEWEEKE